MPELPEVETIRLFLENKLVGKKLTKIEILEKRSFQGEAGKIIGAKIKAVTRKGKVLTIEFLDNKKRKYFASIHLKLSGQLLYSSGGNNATFANKIPLANSDKMPAKTTRVVLKFDDGSALFFNDLRKFGWVKITDFSFGPKGHDVLSEEFTEKYFYQVLEKTSRNIKTVLMDQDKVAGIGNIYANDSLWHAKIHPATKTNLLTIKQKRNLYKSIIKIINEGISKKGSSAQDELYILPDGTKGNYQKYFKVYGRNGEPCLTCKNEIVRMKITGRGTFFCPKCQLKNN